jgi:hypothetical protein
VRALATGAALVAATLLAVACKTDDRIHVECSRVCAHVVDVMTRDCNVDCGDRRDSSKEACLHSDCPSWTPEQTDCMLKAPNVAAVGMCAYQR